MNTTMHPYDTCMTDCDMMVYGDTITLKIATSHKKSTFTRIIYV